MPLYIEGLSCCYSKVQNPQRLEILALACLQRISGIALWQRE